MKTGFILILLVIGCRNTSTNPDSGELDTTDTGPVIPPEQIDDDGDGFTEEQGDCDDSATTVNPAGEEGDSADGRDNDCNGIIDDKPVCPGQDEGIDTLQEAIDSTPEAMTLLVCPGTYEERIEILDRSVGIWAEAGPERTTIQGDQSGPTITISSVQCSAGDS